MHQVQALMRKICLAIGTPAARGVMTLSESGEWAELQKLKLVRDKNVIPIRIRRCVCIGRA